MNNNNSNRFNKGNIQPLRRDHSINIQDSTGSVCNCWVDLLCDTPLIFVLFSLFACRSSFSSLSASGSFSSVSTLPSTLCWYRSLCSSYSQLSGIRLIECLNGDEMGVQKNQCRVLIAIPNTIMRIEIEITFSNDWKKFTHIQQTSIPIATTIQSQSHTLTFDDIFEHGIHQQNLNFICREIIHRCKQQ